MQIEILDATPADVPLLLGFIRKMAEFEKLNVSATEASLQDALFGDAPAARALLVYADGKSAGYATYFFSFTSMMGRRALWLDDLFVDPEFRGKGIGKVLMAYIANIAVQHRCARFEWIVLDWNAPAIEFYHRLGAKILADWRTCRLDEAQMARVAGLLQSWDV
ncbi:MAG TPA: GNAT family N-acetyltransferase [Candidatus Krumholzibacteria bacterium]|nr:GNAT family N-acetyltransferase [Candidatus Krumholzibacteria bacterium]